MATGFTWLGCGDGGDPAGVDAGNNNNTPPFCGNGIVEGLEACDDGSANSDTQPDACRTDCAGHGCGDGVTDTGEGCDDGSANSDTEPDSCRTGCVEPSCGDGVIDTGEGCDEGAANSDTQPDACRTDCAAPGCGDGAIDTGEGCDDGSANSDTEPNACRTSCAVPSCGDGVVDTGEGCDDGNNIPGDGCTDICVLESCGNGVTDPGETCDDGNNVSGDGCRDDCLSNETCGNGLVDPAVGEDCDDGVNNGVTPSPCTADCYLTQCGDGYVGGPEFCDGTNLAGQDCTTLGLGYAGGLLGCDGSCALIDSFCFTCGDGLCESDLGESAALCPADCQIMDIALGYGNSYIVLANGTLLGWGDDFFSALGLGSFGLTESLVPIPCALGIGNALSVSSGNSHACVTLDTGAVACWGRNLNGQAGNGTTSTVHLPELVAGINDAVQVSLTAYSSCVLRATGEVQCWGLNDDGQLGDGTTVERSTPGPAVALPLGALQMDSGMQASFSSHVCAILSDASVWCWGNNDYGQLGDGTTVDASAPVPVSGLTQPVLSVAVGNVHTCAALADGTVACWGRNNWEQLGNGLGSDSPVPQIVAGLTGVATLSAHGSFTCALMTIGELQCWGHNFYGQAGRGSLSQTSPPAPVVGLSGVTKIATGYYHACAEIAGGNVRCWGYNQDGQLGDNTTTNSATPVTPVGL